MKEIRLKKVNEVIYYEKLRNGLDVYLYNKDNFHNNYVTYTTKYGSVYNEFIPYNQDKMKKFPNGIAHFLEHKVFVQESDPQPEVFYAKSGATTNAYTTFKNTTYLFSGPDNLEENINYLLDFVGSINLTKENVESEKGIIIQEINMCDDRPMDVLYDKIRENTLHSNSFKESIIGTKKEVNSITKEDLETCYNTFYHPSNMFLVVTGSFDKDKILDTIKKNMDDKNYEYRDKIERPKIKEKDSVVKEYDVVKINTDIPKLAYNIKININNFDMDERRLSIILFLIFNIIFSDTSIVDSKLKKMGIITTTLGYNLLNCDTHFIISLIGESEKYQELIKEIEKTLSNIHITEEELRRKKKVLISNEIFSYENIEMVNEMIIDNIIFNNQIEDNAIGIVNSISLEEVNNVIKSIDLSNKSIVVIDRKK